MPHEITIGNWNHGAQLIFYQVRGSNLILRLDFLKIKFRMLEFE